jgi:hypothetical protein
MPATVSAQRVHLGIAGCDAVRACKYIPTFRWKILPPSSWLKVTAVLRKQSIGVLSGFIWLRIGTGGSPL